MKPVLNFQIPYPFKMNTVSAESMKRLLDGLQKRLSKDYEVVITPWQLQADNMVNVTITPDTDIEKLLRKLEVFETKSQYDFHRRFLPRDVYNTLDFDGDPDSHPLNAMNAFWYPIIAMINYTDKSDHDLLDVFKERNVNPLAIDKVTHSDDNELWGVAMVSNGLASHDVRHKIEYSDYIIWMLDKVNKSSRDTITVLEQIMAAGVNPMLITSLRDRDGGLPFDVIDELYRIKYSDDEVYLKAAQHRRLNRTDNKEED